MKILDQRFLQLSNATVTVAGHRLSPLLVTVAMIGWIVVGSMKGFPTEWFLIANMVGTAVTVFVLLLVQHSQNRDMHALKVKVDELIRSNGAARNEMIAVERREEREIERMVQDRQTKI
ncbi:low affinity iron permease family protein [Agrobacterium vitis]|uniref:low affinity iron permease family protein n=1 Tax=Agrobacterium vitis TaxID=373 RepID=UPI001573B5F6|nr:low affinity iron permease family protein [Agrobacterium vitis]NSY14818.1 low affinity iron permease family protein [Agrobacterium vitis]NSY24575.1 low affinity iron permease family protein [Agrobacterium vitis]WEO75203.1 low affinity iron permease family protein [Agrobacterium vitis]